MNTNNPPAFPQPITEAHDSSIVSTLDIAGNQSGMTLRDYFAAKALPACITLHIEVRKASGISKDSEELAFLAYSIADSMLAERERKS